MHAMVRRYTTADAKAVRYLAHSDMPDDAMSAVCAVRCDYYIDLEPENGFVVADEFDKPVGYILCSVNRERFNNVFPSYITQLRRSNYKMYAEQKKVFKQSENIPHGYSARFTINVLPSFRGKGRGKALVERLTEHLYAMGIDGMYTISESDSVSAFCERLGFEKILQIDSKHCVYGKRLHTRMLV